ncbi:serine hydrolase domain-containing protein [Alkalihalobacillus hemicellulosilyticus]|uniref:6-aminohexanoate-dimer hydrolase n=1 Tax=Halalkalibacter hemicellulosilyticusJCM 9152 TaxID=1236971 RepID=W4QEL0_9BACI|nr:serine hydrolase [Halalkalibacter hemicellulosilyticus]GAE30515.1 6-aminohexanoate-dimer hydrolase [Halalkalibacter hemicellulosilyticusJCM 9152]
MKSMKTTIVLLGLGVTFGLLFFLPSSEYIPPLETTWNIIEDPEEKGWSIEHLNRAKEYYYSIGSTSAMAIYKGEILFHWGDVTDVSQIHSVRKSFLSALYGIQVEQTEQISLDDTLGNIGISDQIPLTDYEKQATIEDLLTSRSGVYLQAGEESLRMRWRRPSRERYEPGTHFYYNNWDFNVLGTIYNQQTNLDLIEQFHETIALPLGMEDFTLDNAMYKYERSRSIHPSYLFRMSTRDMARFGQLYLQNGVWNGQQIIPHDWVHVSTSVHAHVPNSPYYGYGYMWWVADQGDWASLGLYSAVGRYGQSIDIIPSLDLVFVHKVNSDRFFHRTFRQVNDDTRLHLLKMIIDAKQTK